jgi:hypothetical protein
VIVAEKSFVTVALAPALGLALALAVPVAPSVGARAEAVSVHVQRPVSVTKNVHIRFRAGGQLPKGGYYYAVIVLKPYRHYTRSSPPPCSASSNMRRTDYGYPQADRTVKLALTPARSRAGHWCHGGSYVGAVYAVPKAPPCESRYPCRAEYPSPCWETSTGHRVCGVVVRPREYSYPDGLPKPVASGTRVVGHFGVAFN